MRLATGKFAISLKIIIRRINRGERKEPDDFEEIVGDDGLPIRTQGSGAFNDDD